MSMLGCWLGSIGRDTELWSADTVVLLMCVRGYYLKDKVDMCWGRFGVEARVFVVYCSLPDYKPGRKGWEGGEDLATIGVAISLLARDIVMTF